EGADAQATAGDSAAGARPAATKPKAAINATSKAVRISDVSPMSPSPAETTPGHCGGCTAISAAKGDEGGVARREVPRFLLYGHFVLFCPYQWGRQMPRETSPMFP